MSQFINSPEAVFAAECVLLNTFSYTVEELTDTKSDLPKLAYPGHYVSNDGEEFIGKLISIAKKRFRMYGSARELAENVKIFRNTPGSYRYFNQPDRLLYPYYTVPVVYKSLKDEEYICKHDAYLILQNMTMEAYPFEKHQVFRSLVAILLRSHELAYLKKVEFVKFDQKIFNEINKEIKKEFENFKKDPSTLYPPTAHLFHRGFDQMCQNFKRLIPIEWRDADNQYFENMIGLYLEEFAMAPNTKKRLEVMYSTTARIVIVLKTIIESRVEIFKNQGSEITVRLFEDGDKRFVMKAELMEAICRLENSKNNYKKEEMIMDTMDMKEVENNYGDRIQKIEFIRTPILRAKHRAVPIPIETPFFGILATDMLFEFLRNVIFGYKAFQDQTYEFVQKLTFEDFFNPEAKDIYFLKTVVADGPNQVFGLLLKNNRTVKEVRNAKKDGFTLQNLKNELAHLELLSAFPEIQKHADIVYAEIDKRKKEPVLRTCDLFDAIEQCQLICIFTRLPNLRKFLHNQKSCHRVIGMDCFTCPAFYQSDDQKTTESGAETLKVASDTKDQKPATSESKKPKQKTSKAIPEVEKAPELKTTDPADSDVDKMVPLSKNASEDAESTESEPKTSQSTPDVKKAPEAKSTPPDTQKQKSKASQPKNPSLDPQKPSESQQKTSANCEKCYRTCEMLNETKRELKTSENKLKNMEKKMLGKEREMDELKKNEMEKIEEKEKEIEKRLEEIQGLEMRIQEKEEQNRNLNRQITELKSSMKKEREDEKNVLEEQVFRLEKKIEEERKQSDKEIRGLKTEIQETNRKMGELKEREIRIGAENEVNERMIQQLLNKLTPPPPSQFRIHSSSSSQRVEKCEICWKETNESIIRCQKCRRPFHDKCATQWINDFLNCPACDEEFVKL